ncbi:dTDP-4-dehydrorhamnose reductase [Stutzerimonas zhaodongensis]|uniref:dTDP-4-dehydrorhamnose reductase n=1 Tax=Stutzerimonas zhaodongensis TaxID=1176257 RepID=UPI0039F13D25
MNILLLGANGQVGWELQRALAPLGQLHICDRKRADLCQPQSLARLIDQIQPQIIVNAAAYTAVDKAETDQVTAKRVNADAVATLASAARKLDAWLVHYSTDYVFDGSNQSAYVENDRAAPLSVYGATKLEGENHIRASGCKHLILRTSWVYAARGSNFAKTMLRLAAEREGLSVVSDQIGAPTSAELIADVSALMLQRLVHDEALAANASGTYHLVAQGETSWHGYAQFIIEKAAALGVLLKTASSAIRPIRTDEYPVPAKRPINSRLCTDKLRRTFGLDLPRWEHHAERLLAQILPGILRDQEHSMSSRQAAEALAEKAVATAIDNPYEEAAGKQAFSNN